MAVRIEKSSSIWTAIHSRPEARNAMDPVSAEAIQEAFLEFEKEESASVAVFWREGTAFCAGWDLMHAAALEGDDVLNELDFSRKDPRTPSGPMGPSRLELGKPAIAAIAGPAVGGGMELELWLRFQDFGRKHLLWCLLQALGDSSD